VSNVYFEGVFRIPVFPPKRVFSESDIILIDFKTTPQNIGMSDLIAIKDEIYHLFSKNEYNDTWKLISVVEVYSVERRNSYREYQIIHFEAILHPIYDDPNFDTLKAIISDTSCQVRIINITDSNGVSEMIRINEELKLKELLFKESF